jgi:Lon protease-like protein
MLDEARRPAADILGTLPIFPLPNVVLLPGMVLPLSVFEKRYIDLVDHVMHGGAHIGVPLLRPGFARGFGERPAFEPVFGLGRLLSHHELADGRRLIRLEGLGRVRMLRELPSRTAFRQVACEILDEDHPTAHGELEVLRAQVERIASTLEPDDADVLHAILRVPDARLMIYAIAAIVPCVDPTVGLDAVDGRSARLELQQRCLDAETADARVRRLLARSATISHELSESGAFPVAVFN